MAFKIAIKMVLIVLLVAGRYGSASVADRPALIAPKASESILLDIARAGDQRLVTVGDRGHILYSDDHGERWRQAQVPTQKMLTAISFPSADIGYAAGHDAIILKTTDAGVTWRKLYDDLELGVPLLDIRFISERHGIAVGAYGLALKTVDGGKSWQSISERIGNRDELHLNAVTGSENNLFLAGEQGILFHSKDFGESWQSLDSGYKGSWFGLVGSTQKLWLYGLRGTVYHSESNGRRWSDAGIKTKQTVFGATLIDDEYPVLVGDAGMITVKKQDQWHHWQFEQRNTLSAVIATDDQHLIVVGEMGVEKIALETIFSGERH